MAGSALAQEPPPATAPAPASAPSAAAPDIVMLRSGGLVRGTISELEPGVKVVILTMTGEEKTFPMSDVRYAGAASEAPRSKPAASVAPDAGEEGNDEAGETESGEGAGKKEFGGAIVKRKPELRPEITVHAREARLSLSVLVCGIPFAP